MVVHDDAPVMADAATPDDAAVADAVFDSPASLCPGDYVNLPGMSAKYKAFSWSANPGNDRSQPWLNAAAICSGEGTHLAFPADASEATALQAAVAVAPNSPFFWAGLTDAAVEGSWRTSLGAIASYLPWDVGQPNGGTSANCALEGAGKLYDWQCTTPYPFLCRCD
jgi:hypothetical protein